MVVDTIKENLCVNKLVATKKEVILVEGDMIVPDSKPDILNTICTSGVVCIYKKEVLEEKVRIDGNINTYIMYMADDSKDKVRGLTTSLDFSESIQIANCKEGMNCKLNTKLNDFIKSKEYEDYLSNILMSLNAELFSNDNGMIYLTKFDYDKYGQFIKENIKERFNFNCSFSCINTIIGGLIIENTKKEFKVDMSIDSILEENKLYIMQVLFNALEAGEFND